MSTLAARLAAQLEAIPAEAKATLVKLLRAQISSTKPAAPKVPRKSAKDSLLLDTRTVAELWLAGEMPDARNRAAKRAPKGAYRSISVTLADGFTIKAGSYLADDAAAKAEVVRFARSRAMESEFAKSALQVAPAFRALAFEHGPGWQWVRLPDGSTRRTRACAVPDVATVDFAPVEPVKRLIVLQHERSTKQIVAEVVGDFCEVDSGELARRARALRCGYAAYPLPVPLSVLGAAPEIVGPCCALEAREPAEEPEGDTVVAFQAPKRTRSSWVLYAPDLYVAYVGPRRDAQAMLKIEPGLCVARLPAGWRSGPNPWAGDLAVVVDNARARVDGQRQRLSCDIAA